MDFKIHIGSSLAPQEKTVSKDKTVRELLTEMNVPFKDGQVTRNGSVLGTADLNKSLADLGIQDNDFILAVSKHTDGV